LPEQVDSWAKGEEYERFMGRWSRRVARQFLDWLAVPPQSHWLEVGCGTGALTDTICRTEKPATVVACDPSEAFVSFARRGIGRRNVTFVVRDVNDIPKRGPGYDAAVSGLVLNFLPKPAAALRSMHAALRPGGPLAAYVWDYADGMQFLRIFWESAVALDPAAAALDEGLRFPLCRPEALVELFRAARLRSVEVTGLEIETSFPDFASFWSPFLGGTGAAPAYVASLRPDARERLREHLRERLSPGPILLTARAWAARGFAVRTVRQAR
jgi:SAM-dependent methyltransferase